jgi:hypothetical protein
MRQSSARLSGLFDSVLHVTIMAALCAVFLGYDSDVRHGTTAASEPAHFAIWKKRIKRLKLADPESTETMLADVARVSTQASHRKSA